MSQVFTHSDCMGMNAFPFDKAQELVTALDLPADAADLLSEPPTKIWSQAVPTDLCLYTCTRSRASMDPPSRR